MKELKLEIELTDAEFNNLDEHINPIISNLNLELPENRFTKHDCIELTDHNGKRCGTVEIHYKTHLTNERS